MDTIRLVPFFVSTRGRLQQSEWRCLRSDIQYCLLSRVFYIIINYKYASRDVQISSGPITALIESRTQGKYTK